MLTEIYIEGLLVDEKLADQVWEACLWGQFSLRNSANCAEIGGAWRTAAFPESRHSDHLKSGEIRGRFRPQGDIRDQRKAPPKRGYQYTKIVLS